MKTSLKIGLVITLLVIVAASSASVYAVIFAVSDIVHVDVQYNVVLSQDIVGDKVTLTATVTNNAQAVDGRNVDFYVSVDSGDWSIIGSIITSNKGVATYEYTLTANGAYDFKAVVTVME